MNDERTRNYSRFPAKNRILPNTKLLQSLMQIENGKSEIWSKRPERLNTYLYNFVKVPDIAYGNPGIMSQFIIYRCT